MLQALGVTEGTPSPHPCHPGSTSSQVLAGVCTFCTVLPVLPYTRVKGIQSYMVMERRFRIPSEDPQSQSHYKPEEAMGL